MGIFEQWARRLTSDPHFQDAFASALNHLVLFALVGTNLLVALGFGKVVEVVGFSNRLTKIAVHLALSTVEFAFAAWIVLALGLPIFLYARSKARELFGRGGRLPCLLT